MPTVKKTTIKPAVKKTTVKAQAKTTAVKAKVEKKITPVKSASTQKAALKTKVTTKVSPKNQALNLPKETTLKQSVYDVKGQVSESITLPKDIFDAKINDSLMSQAVRVYLANKRRGTVKTKSRGEVKISTRKIYRQKGTGRARHGAASAPIFVGGGIAFGPKQRDYSLKLSQKMRKLALFSALTTKLKNGEIKIVKGLEKLEPKTKLMSNSLSMISLDNKKPSLLLITPKPEAEFAGVVKSARNINGVEIRHANLLNTYDVLKSKHIVLMKESVDALVETFLNKE